VKILSKKEERVQRALGTLPLHYDWYKENARQDFHSKVMTTVMGAGIIAACIVLYPKIF